MQEQPADGPDAWLGAQVLVGRALQAGQLAASQVAYVAVHGTGTPLGDPIEVGALAGALAGSPQAPIIGSVKARAPVLWTMQSCASGPAPGLAACLCGLGGQHERSCSLRLSPSRAHTEHGHFCT